MPQRKNIKLPFRPSGELNRTRTSITLQIQRAVATEVNPDKTWKFVKVVDFSRNGDHIILNKDIIQSLAAAQGEALLKISTYRMDILRYETEFRQNMDLAHYFSDQSDIFSLISAQSAYLIKDNFDAAYVLDARIQKIEERVDKPGQARVQFLNSEIAQTRLQIQEEQEIHEELGQIKNSVIASFLHMRHGRSEVWRQVTNVGNLA